MEHVIMSSNCIDIVPFSSPACRWASRQLSPAHDFARHLPRQPLLRPRLPRAHPRSPQAPHWVLPFCSVSECGQEGMSLSFARLAVLLSDVFASDLPDDGLNPKSTRLYAGSDTNSIAFLTPFPYRPRCLIGGCRAALTRDGAPGCDVDVFLAPMSASRPIMHIPS